MKPTQVLVLLAFLQLMQPAALLQGQKVSGHATGSAGGSIRGIVEDADGAVVVGAEIHLFAADSTDQWTITTAIDGVFHYENIPPGSYTLRITAKGFAEWSSGDLRLAVGETRDLARIVLNVAASVTNVQVGVSRLEIAQEQVRIAEQQRLLGVIPNFHVSYTWNAAPLSAKQKFELAWRESIDPYAFIVTGIGASVEQARNTIPAFGQGMAGYSKRYAAAYGDIFNTEMIGGALLPSLLHQDPRYFVKGHGSIASRTFYALGSAFICRGDNGHWQPNISTVGGAFAAAEISNLYYPKGSGSQITLGNILLTYGETAGSALLEEFLSRKITPSVEKKLPAEVNLILRRGTPITLAFSDTEKIEPGMHVKLLLVKDLKVDSVVVANAGATAQAEVITSNDTNTPCLRIQWLQVENTPIHLRWSKNAESSCTCIDSQTMRSPSQMLISAGTTVTAYVDESVSLHETN